MVRPEEVLHHLERLIEAGGRHVVANHNLHSIALYRTDPELRAFYARAALIECDSIPLILWSRLLGRKGRRLHRCTYLDWREHFWSVAERRGWRVLYIGGAPGVADRAAERLRQRRPGAVIGALHGYFDMAPGSAENAAVVDAVREFQPHVLFVGMGMPRQERWIERNHDALPPCVLFSVGAAFDYEAGEQAAAPRWLGRLGLEWLYRLARDPRRLAHRYLVEPWTLLGPAARDVAGAVRARRSCRPGAGVPGPSLDEAA